MEEKDKIKILKEAEQAIKMCKVISNKSFKDFNRYWIRQDKAFQKYSQCYCFSNEILKEYLFYYYLTEISTLRLSAKHAFNSAVGFSPAHSLTGLDLPAPNACILYEGAP